MFITTGRVFCDVIIAKRANNKKNYNKLLDDDVESDDVQLYVPPKQEPLPDFKRLITESEIVEKEVVVVIDENV